MERNPQDLSRIPDAGESPISCEHAQLLLQAFCREARRGRVRPALLDYVVRALEQILDGDSADVVLGLQRGRPGRPRTVEPLGLPASKKGRRDFLLAGMVLELVAQGHKQTSAYTEAAQTWNDRRPKKRESVSASTVQRAWKLYGDRVRFAESVRKPYQPRSEYLNGKIWWSSQYLAATPQAGPPSGGATTPARRPNARHR